MPSKLTISHHSAAHAERGVEEGIKLRLRDPARDWVLQCGKNRTPDEWRILYREFADECLEDVTLSSPTLGY